MSVKVKKHKGKWYVFVDYHGRRKAKCIGASRAVAEQVKRMLEARLALGDLGFMVDAEEEVPLFGGYARIWQKEYVEINCKPSTATKHDEVLRLYLLPVFEKTRLTELTRDRVKRFLAHLVTKPKRARKRPAEGEPEPAVETLSPQQRQACPVDPKGNPVPSRGGWNHYREPSRTNRPLRQS
jgi:hypothetical protein